MKRFLFSTSLLVLASPAFAQTDAAGFVTKAAIGDMFEIRSSELAADRAQNSDYKAFATKIIEDHRANSEELKAMLQRSTELQRIQLPTALDAAHQQKLQQLQSTTAGFERAYRAAQIDAHEQAIQMFDGYARSGDNAELKAWAAEKVPVLRDHLQMAQALPQPPAPATAATQPSAGTVGQTAQTAQPRTQATRPAPQTAQGQAVTKPAEGKATILSALGPGHIMASDLEGTTVYGMADEKVGEIDEVILDRTGRVVAVVVGVGGFLGIGEKNVAIPFEALEIVASDRSRAASQGVEGTAQPAPGTARTGSGVSPETETIDPSRVVLRGMTKEELERAPEFRSVAR
jgi:putative membrane protein